MKLGKLFGLLIRKETLSHKRYFGALTDSTGVLLTIHSNPAVLVFLQECTMDTYHVSDVSFHYPEPFFLQSVPAERFPEWTWASGGPFKPTLPDLITDALRARAALASEKARVLNAIMLQLSRARSKVVTGVSFQEIVYEAKRQQAKQFRESGYDEGQLMECPLVVQYADFAGVSLKQAANDILFKAKLDSEHLAKTELLRLKYFNLIREAREPAALAQIWGDFNRDAYVFARV